MVSHIVSWHIDAVGGVHLITVTGRDYAPRPIYRMMLSANEGDTPLVMKSSTQIPLEGRASLR